MERFEGVNQMEKDIEEIRAKIEEFMKKYSVTVIVLQQKQKLLKQKEV